MSGNTSKMHVPFSPTPSYSFAKQTSKNAVRGKTPPKAIELSREDCKALCRPLIKRVESCTVFDVFGLSMQIMVLDIYAPLTVAFIAAQETRLHNGVLWDPFNKQFITTFTSTDFIKILLYFDLNHRATGNLATWRILDWIKIRNSQEVSAFYQIDFQNPSKPDDEEPLFSCISCFASSSLLECLEILRKRHVRCVGIVDAPENKPECAFNVISVMDIQQIVDFLFFGSSEGEAGQVGSPSGTFSLPMNGGGEDLGAMDDDLGLPETVPIIHSMYNSDLPSSVSRIIGGGKMEEGSSCEGHLNHVKPGPYSSLLDVPFNCLPSLGKHRNHQIYVTSSDTIVKVLQLFLLHDIETIAVCTGDLIITDVISRSDLIHKEHKGIYKTSLTVKEVLEPNPMRMVNVFRETDILWDIFSYFANKRVRELFLVDYGTNRLVGQLNIEELVHFLVTGSSNN